MYNLWGSFSAPYIYGHENQITYLYAPWQERGYRDTSGKAAILYGAALQGGAQGAPTCFYTHTHTHTVVPVVVSTDIYLCKQGTLSIYDGRRDKGEFLNREKVVCMALWHVIVHRETPLMLLAACSTRWTRACSPPSDTNWLWQPPYYMSKANEGKMKEEKTKKS